MCSMGMKDDAKPDKNTMDDGDFLMNIFNLDDEDLNDFLGTGDKGFNVSGAANEGDQVNVKEKVNQNFPNPLKILLTTKY